MNKGVLCFTSEKIKKLINFKIKKLKSKTDNRTMMASLVFIYVMNYNGISVLFIVYYCLYMYFKFRFF